MLKNTAKYARQMASAMAWDMVDAIAGADRLRKRCQRLEDLVMRYQTAYPVGIKSVLFWARNVAATKGPLPVDVDEAIKTLAKLITDYDAECKAARDENTDVWAPVFRDPNGEIVKP